MGTRNLTAVFYKGEYKIAQYGQWDGNPSGQGLTVLEFLKKGHLNVFKNKLKNVRFIDLKGRDKEFTEEYDKNAPQWSNDPDNRTSAQKVWFETYMSRNLGAEILSNIEHSESNEILLENNINFASESLHCEWAYVIDFDLNCLEVYSGFNKEKVKNRFSDIPLENESYQHIKLLHSFKLYELPDEEEFLKILEPEDEEE
jgi:hypothetical protein